MLCVLFANSKSFLANFSSTELAWQVTSHLDKRCLVWLGLSVKAGCCLFLKDPNWNQIEGSWVSQSRFIFQINQKTSWYRGHSKEAGQHKIILSSVQLDTPVCFVTLENSISAKCNVWLSVVSQKTLNHRDLKQVFTFTCWNWKEISTKTQIPNKNPAVPTMRIYLAQAQV